MSNCSLPGFTHRSGSSTVNDWLQSLVELARKLITVRESIHQRPAIPWCPVTVCPTSRTVFVWTFPVSFPNCNYRSWSRHQIKCPTLTVSWWFFRNPSPLSRYGQTGRYPPALVPRRVWRRWTWGGYPIVRVLLVVCKLTTLHLGRDDRGKENTVSPP